MDGQRIERIMDAVEKMDVVYTLRENSFYPLEIKQIKELKSMNQLQIFNKTSLKDLSIFCKQYAAILKVGIPAAQGLGIVIDQISNPGLKESLKDVYFLVQGGETLSRGMMSQDKIFPMILISTIESGEVGGSLEASFQSMSDYFERQFAIKQKIEKALSYPMILTFVSMLIIAILMKVIMPQFMDMYSNSETQLPGCTRLLIGLYNFFIHNFIWMLLLAISSIPMLKILLSLDKLRILLHSLLLKLPPIGKITNKIITARFNRTMSIVMSAGISIVQALTIASKVTKNQVIVSGLNEAIIMVQQGESLAQSLKTSKIFSPDITNIIAIGEETGRVEEMMDKVADICEIEAETAIDRFVILLEPMTIAILGGIIAFIVISVALPMFQMYVLID